MMSREKTTQKHSKSLSLLPNDDCFLVAVVVVSSSSFEKETKGPFFPRLRERKSVIEAKQK